MVLAAVNRGLTRLRLLQPCVPSRRGGFNLTSTYSPPFPLFVSRHLGYHHPLTPLALTDTLTKSRKTVTVAIDTPPVVLASKRYLSSTAALRSDSITANRHSGVEKRGAQFSHKQEGVSPDTLHTNKGATHTDSFKKVQTLKERTKAKSKSDIQDSNNSASTSTAASKSTKTRLSSATTRKRKATSAANTAITKLLSAKTMSRQANSTSTYTNFAILTQFRRLPYKVKTLTKTDQIALARYFDLEPFFAQPDRHRWEVYHDTDQFGKPVLLITLKQAWAYMDHVSQRTGIDIPKHPKSNYCYKKQEGPVQAPEPVKVGLVGSKEEWQALTEQFAAGTSGRGGDSGKTPEEKAEKKRQQEEKRIRNMTSFGIQITRASELLHLPQAFEQKKNMEKVAEVILKDWEARDDEEGGVRITADGVMEKATFVTTVVSNEQTTTTTSGDENGVEEVPFFVCVDVESWERNHAAITEIGIATLDIGAALPSTPEHVTNPLPKITYESIVPHMKYRHIRVREHKNLKNGRFVPDNSDRFDFGKTEMLPLSALPATIAESFTPPPLVQSPLPNARKRKRVIAFVGHDAPTDIRYLHDVKFDCRVAVRNTLAALDAADGVIASGSREMEVFDTAQMYRAITGETNARALGRMLVDLELNPWNLHNAGNDAAFTLMGFVRMCDPVSGPDSASATATAS